VNWNASGYRWPTMLGTKGKGRITMAAKDIWLLADFTCKEGKAEEMKEHLRELITDVRQEKGCLFDDCFQDAEDPLKFRFVEHWATEDDMNNHINGEPAARWEKNAGHLRATDPALRTFKTIWE
jgi:quinol monooxygenase YgiN